MSNVSGAPHHTLGSSVLTHGTALIQARFVTAAYLLMWYESSGSSSAPSLTLRSASTRQIHRPPGVRRVTFLSHTRRIYDGSVPDDIGLCILMSAYPPATASDAVRVTRAKSFPAPSFRQYLTIPPLVFD